MNKFFKLKTCRTCLTGLPLTSFWKTKKTTDGLRWSCINCEKLNKGKRGLLTKNQYEKLLKHQKGSCAICNKKAEEFNKFMSTDHCHKTGTIRGLLCQKCNVGLGMFNDNVETLQQAAKYLKVPKKLDKILKENIKPGLEIIAEIIIILDKSDI